MERTDDAGVHTRLARAEARLRWLHRTLAEPGRDILPGDWHIAIAVQQTLARILEQAKKQEYSDHLDDEADAYARSHVAEHDMPLAVRVRWLERQRDFIAEQRGLAEEAAARQLHNWLDNTLEEALATLRQEILDKVANGHPTMLNEAAEQRTRAVVCAWERARVIAYLAKMGGDDPDIAQLIAGIEHGAHCRDA